MILAAYQHHQRKLNNSMYLTTWIRALRAVGILALFLACEIVQAQAKYEPGYSRFAVTRSVTVTRDNAIIRKGPRPDSAEYMDCGRGFTAGVFGQTRTSFRIIFGDIASPEYGYIAKSDVHLLRRSYHLEDKAFYVRDLTSHRISYHTEAGKRFAVVEARLDAWDDIAEGSGSFQKLTPEGTVSVRWRRGWASMSKDETGRPVSIEFSSFPMYYITIDAPKSVSVHLRTQEYGVDAVYVNGQWLPFGIETGSSIVHDPYIPLQPYIKGRQIGPGDKEAFALNLPGGHTQLVLRMDVFWSE